MEDEKYVEDLKRQSDFCKDLMERLDEKIQSAEPYEYCFFKGVKNHIQMQEDIRRLRRELMKLHHML